MSQQEKQPLVLVGGGGHCRACLDVLEGLSHYRIEGVLDKSASASTDVMGYPIVGTDADVERLAAEGMVFLITIGQIKDSRPRQAVFERVRSCGAKLATIVGASAHVSDHARVGEGTVVLDRVHVGPMVVIGSNCILNTGCIIEHDAVVGSHSHISTGALVNGGATIGQGCFIGSNATIREGITLGDNCVVSAGVFVSHSLRPGALIKSAADVQEWST